MARSRPRVGGAAEDARRVRGARIRHAGPHRPDDPPHVVDDDAQVLVLEKRPLHPAILDPTRSDVQPASYTRAAMSSREPLLPETFARLPVWAGFSAGPPGRPSTGEVMIEVGGDAMIGDESEITPEHTTAYRFSLEHAEAMQAIVLDAIAAWVPSIRERYEAHGVAIPASLDHATLRDHVKLTSLAIHHAHARGLAYVGYQLACRWDREHGLGVMTHERRVVKVGGADTAILGWIAERDLAGPTPAKKPAAKKAAPRKRPATGKKLAAERR